MIARFAFKLPFPVNIRPTDSLRPFFLSHKGVECLIYPPLQGSSGNGAGAPNPDILSVDGESTYLADILQVDIRGEFDRTEGVKVVSEYKTALEICHRVITLMRALLRSCDMRPPDEKSSWRLDYLKDDGTEFENVTGLVRGRGAVGMSGLERAWLSPEAWNSLHTEAHDSALSSGELLLDAISIGVRFHIGASIVLAHTAIEVRIATALDALAGRNKDTISEAFWSWICDRGSFLKDPSVEEQLTNILHMLCGKSLKNEKKLWSGYCDLRKARNSFVHGGTPLLPGGAPVTHEKSLELCSVAHQVVEWIELNLMDTERRPSVSGPERTFKFLFPITVAQTSS